MTTQFVNPTMNSEGGPIRAEVGSPVRLHHLPDWLRRRLLKVLDPKPHTAAWAVAMAAQEQFDGAAWLDHWGSTRIPDHDRPGQTITAFVSEPYGLSERSLHNALRFAAAVDCRLDIDACSVWFPTRTLRLTFTPRTEIGAR